MLLGCLAYCVPICLVPLYDRYVIGVLPLLLCLMAISANRLPQRVQRRRLVLAACVLAPYMLFSVAGVRDYLAWNRLRWEALRTLMKEQSISPAQIDGGYEFNGWYGYRADYRPSAAKSWWWVHDDQYLVAAGPVERYETVREFAYSRWLPPRQAQILLLRRLPGGGAEKGDAQMTFRFKHVRDGADAAGGVPAPGGIRRWEVPLWCACCSSWQLPITYAAIRCAETSQSILTTWDGQFYYAILRSAVFDHDADLRNELRLLTPSAATDPSSGRNAGRYNGSGVGEVALQIHHRMGRGGFAGLFAGSRLGRPAGGAGQRI